MVRGMKEMTLRKLQVFEVYHIWCVDVSLFQHIGVKDCDKDRQRARM